MKFNLLVEIDLTEEGLGKRVITADAYMNHFLGEISSLYKLEKGQDVTLCFNNKKAEEFHDCMTQQAQSLVAHANKQKRLFNGSTQELEE